MVSELNKIHFRHPAEFFARARRALMAPHSQGVEASFAEAFELCDSGLRCLNFNEVDEVMHDSVEVIKNTIDVSAATSSDRSSDLWKARAGQICQDEQFEFSRAVDDFASWLSTEYWED